MSTANGREGLIQRTRPSVPSGRTQVLRAKSQPPSDGRSKLSRGLQHAFEISSVAAGLFLATYSRGIPLEPHDYVLAPFLAALGHLLFLRTIPTDLHEPLRRYFDTPFKQTVARFAFTAAPVAIVLFIADQAAGVAHGWATIVSPCLMGSTFAYYGGMRSP